MVNLEYFKKAIAEEDLGLIRSGIITELNSGRSSKYDELENQIMKIEVLLAKKGLALFSEENGKYFFQDLSIVDSLQLEEIEDLWTTVKVEILYNFSKEKKAYLFNLMRMLRGKKHDDFILKEENTKKSLSDENKNLFQLIIEFLRNILGIGCNKDD